MIGTLEGRHIPIIQTSTNYETEEGGQSTVPVLALVNSNYELIHVDIGAEKYSSDGEFWKNSSLKKLLDDDVFPVPSRLTGTNDYVPYVVLADDAFPLQPYLMKRYPGNGRSQKERSFTQVFEATHGTANQAFNILYSRFGVLRGPVYLHPSKVKKILLAVFTIHNLLRKLCPHESFDRIENNFPKFRPIKEVESEESKDVRKKYANYFSSLSH